MQIFIAFHSEDQAIPMLDSAKRWAKCRSASPNIIQVPEQGFEIKRRVLADNLAKEDYYILADMGCVPGDVTIIKQIKAKLKEEPYAILCGLFPHVLSSVPCIALGTIFEMHAEGKGCPYCDGMRALGMLPGIPSGIRVCKKGAIEKWPQAVTEKYDLEHAQAARNSIIDLPDNIIKQRVKVWGDVYYANFAQC